MPDEVLSPPKAPAPPPPAAGAGGVHIHTAAPPASPPPARGGGDDVVPRARLNEEIARRQALEEAAGKVPTLERELARVQAKHAQEMLLVSAGGKFAQSARLRRMLRREYAEDCRGEEKPPDFAAWLEAAKSDPILAEYFDAAAAAAEEQAGGKAGGQAGGNKTGQPPAGEKKPPPADPNVGTGGAPAGEKTTWTAEQLRAMRRANGGRLPRDVMAAYIAGEELGKEQRDALLARYAR